MFQNFQCTRHAFGDWKIFGDFLHHAFVQAFEQRNPAFETFAKIDFAPHCRFCDCLHLVANSGAHCEFVDYLGLNQRGIHIEAYQTAVAAVEVVFLERNVVAALLREAHKLAVQQWFVFWRTAHRHLHTGACLAFESLVFHERHTSGKARYGIDVKILICKHFGNVCNQRCRYVASQKRYDVAVFALEAHPMVIFFHRHWRKPHLHAHFTTFEEHFLQDASRRRLVALEHYAKRQRTVNVCLTDVKYGCAVFGDDGGELRRQAGLIDTRDGCHYYFEIVHISNFLV